MSKYPRDIPVATQYGTIYLTIPSGEGIYVRSMANNNSNVEIKGQRVGIQIYMLIDAETGELSFKPDYLHCYSIYKADSISKPIPTTYEAKIRAELMKVVSEWVVNNPDVIAEGEADHKAEKIKDAKEKIASIEKEIIKKQEELFAAQDELRKLL